LPLLKLQMRVKNYFYYPFKFRDSPITLSTMSSIRL
jgi:hypothetical protein